MPLNIRNKEVNRLATKLAMAKQVSKTDAVERALENELCQIAEAMPLRDRLKPLQDRIKARQATGLDADKAFYDELSEDSHG